MPSVSMMGGRGSSPAPIAASMSSPERRPSWAAVIDGSVHEYVRVLMLTRPDCVPELGLSSKLSRDARRVDHDDNRAKTDHDVNFMIGGPKGCLGGVRCWRAGRR